MSSSTALGFEYLVTGDAVADTPPVMQDLANYLNNVVGVHASGVAVVNITAVNTTAMLAIAFPVGRFTAAPRITITPIALNNPHEAFVGMDNITATGFTLSARRSLGSADLTVHWHAIQQGA